LAVTRITTINISEDGSILDESSNSSVHYDEDEEDDDRTIEDYVSLPESFVGNPLTLCYMYQVSHEEKMTCRQRNSKR